VFADIDADDDLDLFIGDWNGTITFYENTGTSQSASWASPIINYNSIDVGTYCAPAFGDIDADHDLDLFVGEYNGTIVFYENIGSPQSAAWAPPQYNYNSIDTLDGSGPAFADIDSDGDLDLFVGGYGYGFIVF